MNVRASRKSAKIDLNGLTFSHCVQMLLFAAFIYQCLQPAVRDFEELTGLVEFNL